MYIHWNVSPEIVQIGPFALRWYSLFFMISFILGYFIFKWIFREEGKHEKYLDELFLYMFFGTIIGARLGHVLFYDPAFYFRYPLEIIKVWHGGLASHGAAIGILLAIYLYSRKKADQPFLWVIDRISLVVALAGFFIRMGNLFNSEILGKPTDVPWAFIFSRVDNIPRHPAQLYEAIAYLIIFFILLKLYRKYRSQTPQGLLLGWFFILIFSFRFLVEFLKERQAAFHIAIPLDMGQILSIPFIIMGVLLVFYSRRIGPASPTNNKGKAINGGK